jgi:hypothetical protein
MQITFQPLQIVSRLLATIIVALPLAWLRTAVDDYESQTIGKMSHKELVSYINEGHASSYYSAFVMSAIMLLIVILLVEAIAFGIRLIVGLCSPAGREVHDEPWVESETSP